MDLTAGLLKSNETIAGINPIGHFMEGAKTGLEIKKSQMENEKTRYNQDQQYKLQQAIQQSVNAAGDIDYEALGKNGAKLGVSPQVIDYAIKTLPSQWDAIQKTAQSKRQLAIASPEGAKQANEATGWRAAPVKPAVPTQSSSNAPAIPAAKVESPAVAPEMDEKAALEAGIGQAIAAGPNPQGNAIPTELRKGVAYDNEGNVIGLTGTSPAPVAPQAAPPQAPVQAPAQQPAAAGQEMDLGSGRITGNVGQNLFDIGNRMEVPVGTSTAALSTPVTNPLQVSKMDRNTRNSLVESLKQKGLITTKAAVEDKNVQAVLDADLNRRLDQLGNVPTEEMYVDKDGKLDYGAFQRAQSEYKGKKAQMINEATKEFGEAYGNMLDQGLKIAGNRRAEQQSRQSRTEFGQTQDRIASIQATPFEGGKLNKGVTGENVGDIEKNLTAYNRIQGAVKTIEDLKADPNLDKMTADQLAARLKNFNTTMGQVEGLSTESQRETLEEGIRKNPAYATLVKKYGIDLDATNWHDLVNFVKNVGVEKMTAQDRRTFLDMMGSPAEDALKHGAAVTALRIHASAPVEPAKSWRDEPAKKSGEKKAEAPKAGGVVRKQGEKLSDFLKRGGSI